jgi:hypothetical protein
VRIGFEVGHPLFCVHPVGREMLRELADMLHIMLDVHFLLLDIVLVHRLTIEFDSVAEVNEHFTND